MGHNLVQCPRCRGEVWIEYKIPQSAVSRRLKCEVCNHEGFAHVQDIIDYYAFISDKAPEKDKVIRWESYLKLKTNDLTIITKDSAETEG